MGNEQMGGEPIIVSASSSYVPAAYTAHASYTAAATMNTMTRGARRSHQAS